MISTANLELYGNLYRDNIEKAKLREAYAPADADKKRCPHCGDIISPKGLSAHQVGMYCLSMRATLFAQLCGYTRSAIPWNSMTACFHRRFLTNASKPGRSVANFRRKRAKDTTKVKLGYDAWVEKWYAKIWDAVTYTAVDQVYTEKRTKLERSPTIVIPSFQELLTDLAIARKNGATRRFDSIMFHIETQLEDMESVEAEVRTYQTAAYEALKTKNTEQGVALTIDANRITLIEEFK